jgi:hypothetical protein
MKKQLLKVSLLFAISITNVNLNVFGQSENVYFDGSTIGAKGCYDKGIGNFVSTGGTKKHCEQRDVYFAYVMQTQWNGVIPVPATYIGDYQNDYIGTDIKAIESNKYYVVGYTTKAQAYPGVFDPNNSSLYKYYNAFIALVDLNNPSNDWIRVFGDSMTNDKALAVTIDNDNNAWVTGIANEKTPCKSLANSNCRSECYPSSELLFAAFDMYGNQFINNNLNVINSIWLSGNDITFAYNKLYVSTTYSDATCFNGFNTKASVFSYDLSSSSFDFRCLMLGSNLIANGIHTDNNGGVLLVGQMTDNETGFLWQFDQNLNMMTFNEFNDIASKNLGFKSVIIDSICLTITDPSNNIDTFYLKDIYISGDIYEDNSSLSHMMAVKISFNTLNYTITTFDNYGLYPHNFSKNANI